MPPGPTPEQLRKQREAEEKKKRKDADSEWEEKCKKDFENSPMQLYLKDVKANLARDPEFYRRRPAFMQREFLDSGEKTALDAACAVWLKRFGSQLPEIMTTDQCSKAVKVGYDLLK